MEMADTSPSVTFTERRRCCEARPSDSCSRRRSDLSTILSMSVEPTAMTTKASPADYTSWECSTWRPTSGAAQSPASSKRSSSASSTCWSITPASGTRTTIWACCSRPSADSWTRRRILRRPPRSTCSATATGMRKPAMRFTTWWNVGTERSGGRSLGSPVLDEIVLMKKMKKMRMMASRQTMSEDGEEEEEEENEEGEEEGEGGAGAEAEAE
mmetsp:Transcript_691/g.2787  ORF Transcript_691/g.2787 Transcript_691/m.2787 type:complete len:213 (+) Transcript_691:468-1106(+)